MSNLDRARAHLNQGLFDSSDSSEDESKGDDGSLESEDENDRKSAASSFGNEDSDNDDNNNDTPLTALKPSLEKGDKVWAGWWDLSKEKEMNTAGAPWYEGTVHAVKEVARYGNSRASDYGPIRLYDIHYADGDKLKRVLDVFVCPKRDYELTSTIKPKHWKGVRNRVDKNSNDQYAREIGWYEVSSIDGPERNYATLYEAMKQSDRRTIKRMGRDNVRESDLNLPNETLPKKKKNKKKKRERSKNDDDEDNKPSKKKKSNTKSKKIDFNEIFDDTGSDSDESMSSSDDGIPLSAVANAKKAAIKAADDSLSRDDEKKYIGVSEVGNNYRGYTYHDGKQKFAGTYVLKADAAHARDELCRLLKCDKRYNFQSDEEYYAARAKEIKERGLSLQDAGILAEVVEKITARIQDKKEPLNERRGNIAGEESDDESLASDDEEEEESNLNSKLIGDGGQAKYMGANFDKTNRKYKAQKVHNNKSKSLGSFVLAADAAFTRDEFCRAMHIADKGFNFSSTEKYKDARMKEIKRRGLSSQNVPTLAEVTATIQEKRNNWEESSLKNNDTDDSSQSSSDDLPLITMKRKNSRPISPYREEEEATKKTSSIYHGVRYNQRREKSWSTWIFYNGKENSVGVYDLESDAARVYDVVAAILNVSNNDHNFETEADHAQARRREAEKLGLSLESIDSVEASLEKAQTYVGNILAGSDNGVGSVSRKKRAPSVFTPVLTERKKRNVATPPSNIGHSPKKTISDLNDEMAEKWGRRLPATDNPFLDSYQNSLVEMLGGTGGQPRNDMTAISTSTEQPAHIEEEDKNELDSGDKTKSSEHQIPKYTGVTKGSGQNFCSQIGYKGTVKTLGQYALTVDAAHARDEFCRAFNITNRIFNFNTRQEYLDARTTEIYLRGQGFLETRLGGVCSWDKTTDDFLPIDLAEVTSTIQARIARCGASSQSNESAEPPQNIHAVTKLTDIQPADVGFDEQPEEQHEEPASANDNRAVSSAEEETLPNQIPNYKGVTKSPRKDFYKSRIGYNRAVMELGSYSLRVDAAHAYDEFCRASSIKNRGLNFNTRQEYLDARAKEIDLRGQGFSPPDLAEITSTIQARIARCDASSQSNESAEPPQNIHAVTKVTNVQPDDVGGDEKEKPEEQQQELASENDNRAVSSTEEEAIPNNSAEDEVKYFGVTKLKKNGTRFKGQLHYNGKSRSAGDFVLRADAAHAVDVFCRAFNIIKPVNFNTQEEYELAREKEIHSKGLTIDAADTLAKKKEVSSLALVAARLQAKKLLWEKESKEKNLETDNLPENHEPSKEQPQAKSHDDDSDDESLFSDTKEEQENLLLSQDSAAPTVAASNMKAAATPKKAEMNLVSVTKEQEESLVFPVGCSVLWKLQDETFERGVVSKAWLDMNPPINLLYEVEPLNGESRQMKAATELAFDTHCPVYIKSLPPDKTSLREGEVLLSRTDNTAKTCYTILVKADANEFQLIHDVPASQLKYRKIERENTSPSLSRRASNNSESNDQDLHAEEKSQSTKEDKPEKLNTPDRELNDRCDMSISTSNSTISTRPSLSTPRGGRGDNVIRWNEQSIDIQLPSWFVSDNAVKDHLRYHLTGSPRGGKTIFGQIYDKTNCILKMPRSNESCNIITIEAKPGRYAIDSIRKAKIELENMFLNYLQHDGCIGRLFFDLAMSCQYLHPQRGRYCVHQRNPWEPRDMGYMSVVDLPFIGENGKAHTGHILSKKASRVLSRVSQLGCIITVVHRDDRRFPTNWITCRPYIFVWGHKPGDVDEAVEVLNDANREHMKHCKCQLHSR